MKLEITQHHLDRGSGERTELKLKVITSPTRVNIYEFRLDLL